MSDSFLSQEEVDALLEGVTGESQRSEVVEVDLGQVRSYDISSQERIVHVEDQRAPMTRRITRFGPLPNGVCDRRTMATD